MSLGGGGGDLNRDRTLTPYVNYIRTIDQKHQATVEENVNAISTASNVIFFFIILKRVMSKPVGVSR